MFPIVNCKVQAKKERTNEEEVNKNNSFNRKELKIIIIIKIYK